MTANKSRDISLSSQVNAFTSDWFGSDGAGSLRPVEGEMPKIDGENLTWKHMTAQNGYVDLLTGLGSNDFCIGYAWTEIEVPDDIPAWLGLGSDDGVNVWLNGTLVHKNWVQRRCFLDDDVVPLRLKKGKNQILIKIQNVHGLWSYICRLRVPPP